jgi:hypothetical protein
MMLWICVSNVLNAKYWFCVEMTLNLKQDETLIQHICNTDLCWNHVIFFIPPAPYKPQRCNICSFVLKLCFICSPCAPFWILPSLHFYFIFIFDNTIQKKRNELILLINIIYTFNFQWYSLYTIDFL